MFPVHDPDRGGAVVGFVGRTLAQGPDVPKYLNSPQTVLYSKSRLLYGLGAAPTRDALAAERCRCWSRGPLDAIAVTSATTTGGAACTWVGVAPSGTALTAGQVAALSGHAGPLVERGVVVAFDADPSGRHAAVRGYDLLRAASAWPAAAVLPDGRDPASLAQHDGPAALGRLLDAAAEIPLVDLVIEEHLASWAGRLHWAEGRTGALRDAAAIVAAIPPEQVARQVLRLADRLELDPATVTAAVLEQVSSSADRDMPAPRAVPHPARTPTEPVLPVELARADYPGPLRLYRATRTEADTDLVTRQPPTARLGTAAGLSTARGRHAPRASRTGR